MALGNTRDRFGIITIIGHWLVGVMIIGMLALGWYMNALPDEQRTPLILLHKSIGVLLFALVALRVAWHFSQPRPAPLGKSHLLNSVARLNHILLLVAMVAMVVSGWVLSDSYKYPTKFFNLFTMPDILPLNEPLHDAAAQAHTISAWTLAILIGIHVLAVLKHQFINKDGTLMRMLGRVK